MTGSINSNEINFRIQAANTDDILNGSKCKIASANSAGSTGGGYGLVSQPTYTRASSYSASTSQLTNRNPVQTSTKRETSNGDRSLNRCREILCAILLSRDMTFIYNFSSMKRQMIM